MNLAPLKPKKVIPLPASSFGNELSNLQREMNLFMNSFFNERELSIPQSFSSNWFPSLDLRENNIRYSHIFNE